MTESIIVTGAAGFIGSRLVRALNARGERRILAVDNLERGEKCINIADCDIADFIDKRDFFARFGGAQCRDVRAVFHFGACSDTDESDGRYLMANNYEYSKRLLALAEELGVPYIYASSASVYGAGRLFREERSCEHPLTPYAYSKFLFDEHVRRKFDSSPSRIVGLRFFNVYGPAESHKGAMASVVYQFNRQLIQRGVIELFDGSGGYAAGEQRRDFVYIDDAIDVALWAAENSAKAGIFNVGTGKSKSFNDVARAVIAFHGRGEIRTIPFPHRLTNCYQSFTEADLGALRAAECSVRFRPIEQGVTDYLNVLQVRG